MIDLPPDLPEVYATFCKRLQEDFEPDGQYGSVVEPCLLTMEEADINREDVLALLIGLAACKEWLDDPQRETWLEGGQTSRESSRQVADSHYGQQAFESRRQNTRVHTEKGISQSQSLIIYGFILRQGLDHVSAPQWRPLNSILASILETESEDLEEAVYEAIRQRVRRIKKEEPQDEVREMAIRYFNAVYATLYD